MSLADTLGGSLLTVDGKQHTIAVDGTNEGVDDIVADYLVDLSRLRSRQSAVCDAPRHRIRPAPRPPRRKDDRRDNAGRA